MITKLLGELDHEAKSVVSERSPSTGTITYLSLCFLSCYHTSWGTLTLCVLTTAMLVGCSFGMIIED